MYHCVARSSNQPFNFAHQVLAFNFSLWAICRISLQIHSFPLFSTEISFSYKTTCMPSQQEIISSLKEITQEYLITTVMRTTNTESFNSNELSRGLYQLPYLIKNLPNYLCAACSHLDLADDGAQFSQQMKRCQDC